MLLWDIGCLSGAATPDSLVLTGEIFQLKDDHLLYGWVHIMADSDTLELVSALWLNTEILHLAQVAYNHPCV